MKAHSVTALVDTGASYIVISGLFTTKLKKVKTAWEGRDIQTAAAHIITPTGTIESHTYSVSFLVLQECLGAVILGMDFLDHHGIVIDIRSRSIILSTDNATPPESNIAYCTLNVTEQQVTVPPLSSVISVSRKGSSDSQGVFKADQHLLLKLSHGRLKSHSQFP